MKSKSGTINWRDIGRGLFMSVGGAVVTYLQQAITLGMDKVSWTMVGTIALGTGLTYILKNVFTNSDDKMFKKESDNKII